MSYQVLARKWRPQSFDEVRGQPHVTTALRNAIKSGRVPHALLLTGPRGVGKTTLARILARCLNCDEGPTETPCGSCPACADIIAGSSTDVQEIDAASRTSVDDVRELIAAIQYAAAPGKHRIFVVDEVHMLSTAAFNALLKTLEEPPPRSLFVLATTNPEKIPFTVLSRCQRYDLRRISAAEIVEHLTTVSGAEALKISEASLLSIAREADGSMRDAQTLLDQIIAFGGSEVEDSQVAEILDLVDRRVLLAIATACIDGDAAGALASCARAGEAGVDAKRLGENLLQLFRDLVVLAIAPDREGLVEASKDEILELRELAGRSDAARLRRMFRALVKEQEDLAWAPRPFALLELAVVRLATLPAGDEVARLVARLEALERSLGEAGSRGSGPAPSGGGKSTKTRNPGREKRADPPAETRPAGAALRPATAETSAAQPAQLEEPPPASAPGIQPPAECAEMPESAPLPVIFDRLVGRARERHRGIHGALENGRLLAFEGDQLRIEVAERFSRSRLLEKRDELETLVHEIFGRPIQVEIQGFAPPAEPTSPRDSSENPVSLRREAVNDPSVARAIEILDAEIVEIRLLQGPA